VKAVRAVKLYNLSIRRTASEFNMNYCTLSRCCNKISEDYLHENIVISTIQVGYAKNKQDLVTNNFSYTSTNTDEIMLIRRVFA